MKPTTAPSRLHVRVPVCGMACQACAHTIAKTLASIDGILNVDVQFDSRSASFDVDTALLPPNEVGARISAVLAPTGYAIQDEALSAALSSAIQPVDAKLDGLRADLAIVGIFGIATIGAVRTHLPIFAIIVVAGVVALVSIRRILLVAHARSSSRS